MNKYFDIVLWVCILCPWIFFVLMMFEQVTVTEKQGLYRRIFSNLRFYIYFIFDRAAPTERNDLWNHYGVRMLVCSKTKFG